MLTVCQQSVGGASLTAVRGAEGSDVMDREDGEAAPSPTPRQGGMPCFDVVIDDSDESHEMAEEDVSTCAADGPADLLESVAIAHSSPPPPAAAAVQPVKVINSGIHFAPKISISDCSNTHVTFSISEGANAPTVQVEDGTGRRLVAANSHHSPGRTIRGGCRGDISSLPTSVEGGPTPPAKQNAFFTLKRGSLAQSRARKTGKRQQTKVYREKLCTKGCGKKISTRPVAWQNHLSMCKGYARPDGRKKNKGFAGKRTTYTFATKWRILRDLEDFTELQKAQAKTDMYPICALTDVADMWGLNKSTLSKWSKPPS